MAYTLSDIISQVQGRLNDNTFDSGFTTQAINNIQRRILTKRRYLSQEVTQSYTATIGSQSLGAAPVDLQTIIDLRITSPTSYAMKLPYMDYEDFDLNFPQPTIVGNSLPYLWYVFNNAVSLFPAPDKTYGLILRYLRFPTLLVNATDVPQLPEAYQEALVLGAWAQCLERKDYMDESQVVWQQYMQIEMEANASQAARQFQAPGIMRGSRTRGIGRR